MLKYLALIVLIFVLLSSLSLAAVRYSKCEVNDCKITVDECSSGLLHIYSDSTCSDLPKYKYTFYGYSYSWIPATPGTYYVKAFCDDGSQTTCTPIIVQSAATTTTTRYTTTSITTTTAKEQCPYECCENELNYYDKECPAGKECVDNICEKIPGEANYTWVIIVVIVVIIIFILLFFILRPKPKATFEQLYRKWVRSI